MRITYYALKDLQVGEDHRVVGDLVPEAAQWPFLTGYVRDGFVAPVLVATLPEAAQSMLLEWEKAQQEVAVAPAASSESVSQETGTPSSTGNQPAINTKTTPQKQKEKVA